MGVARYGSSLKHPQTGIHCFGTPIPNGLRVLLRKSEEREPVRPEAADGIKHDHDTMAASSA